MSGAINPFGGDCPKMWASGCVTNNSGPHRCKFEKGHTDKHICLCYASTYRIE